jgi:predicted glutamine amidotransferase
VEGNAESRRALRQHNREQIKQHPEWFPAPLKLSDKHWQALAENNHFLSSDHLHNITEVAIHRLEQDVEIDFSSQTTPNDVVTVIATQPLTGNETWQKIMPGEWRLFCLGERVV